MNDEHRRARTGKRGRRQDERPPVAPQEAMRGADRAPDDLSVRAKSSGHGKKTADKWNQ
jgi:hypothetical protein